MGVNMMRQWIGARTETPNPEQWRTVEEELGAYGFASWQLALIAAAGGGVGRLRSIVHLLRD